MDYYIIIPAHNEEAFLASTLDSVLAQTLPPKRVVVVNDHSTDGTEAIIDRYCSQHPVIRKINTTSSQIRLPGSKVVNAFHAGLATMDEDYGFIVKLDADLILPDNYFETISRIFREHPGVGIAGGFFHEKGKDGVWRRVHPMDSDHIRGAFKAYTRECFQAIGGLKSAMGWDTVDELLARYHGFELFTTDSLAVKNLRPVGSAYDRQARLMQGEAMYRMDYGFLISLIASLKMAWMQKNARVLADNLKGYYQARKKQLPRIVTEEEGKFIREYRWKKIRNKLF